MLIFCLVGFVWANGQSSHLWISSRAIDHLPNGELKQLMQDPSVERQWKNGTMFPDGGYAVNDDYGEIAHWESFQIAYLKWIRETYSPPWSVEAKEHIAFLMGLGSHGLADQSFDAMYFRRAYVYDADSMWTDSFDVATDVTFVSETIVQETVDVWVPYEPLLAIFANQGHSVANSIVDQGQSRLNIAVYWVGATSSQPTLVEEYRTQFPWGTSNQQNLDIPGNPEMESQIVAQYWQGLWTQLHSQSVDEVLLFTHPADGTGGHPTDHLDIEAGLSMGLSIGIDADALRPEHVQIRAPSGEFHPVVVDVFYGQDSHIINVEPLEDWSDGVHRVILRSQLPLIGDRKLSDLTDGTDVEWSFSTGVIDDHSTEPVKEGCNATAAVQTVYLWWIGVLGMRWRRI